jgi:hypothetical protein
MNALQNIKNEIASLYTHLGDTYQFDGVECILHDIIVRKGEIVLLEFYSAAGAFTFAHHGMDVDDLSCDDEGVDEAIEDYENEGDRKYRCAKVWYLGYDTEARAADFKAFVHANFA